MSAFCELSYCKYLPHRLHIPSFVENYRIWVRHISQPISQHNKITIDGTWAKDYWGLLLWFSWIFLRIIKVLISDFRAQFCGYDDVLCEKSIIVAKTIGNWSPSENLLKWGPVGVLRSCPDLSAITSSWIGMHTSQNQPLQKPKNMCKISALWLSAFLLVPIPPKKWVTDLCWTCIGL